MRLNLKHGGLPIYFKSDKLFSTKKGLSFQVKIRSLKEVRKVLKDRQIKSNDRAAYLIYRNVTQEQDNEKIKRYNLRYDITVILPILLGSEFPKTIGHYHPLKKGTSVYYPEIYEVLTGEGFFLLQNKELNKIFLIKATKGEKVVVPPGFGHITINTASQPLIISNVSADNFNSEYGFFITHRGGAYYLIEKNKEILIEKNPKYKKVPPLKIGFPKKIKNLSAPLYTILIKTPEMLDFLNNPEKNTKFLNLKNLFKIKTSRNKIKRRAIFMA